MPQDFTGAELTDIKIRLNEVFGANAVNKKLNRDKPVFNGLFGDQQIRMGGDVQMALTNGDYCQAVNFFFLQADELSVDSCTTDCTIPEGKRNTVTTGSFEPNLCFEVKGTVTDQECQTGVTQEEDYAQVIATMLASLDEELESKSIGNLVNIADNLTHTDPVNEYGVGGLDTGNGIWAIPAGDWTPEFIVKLQMLIEDTDMIDAKFVTGNIFREQVMLANAQEGEGCCNYNGLLGAIPTIQNTRKVDSVVGERAAFLVDNAKIGYFCRNKHTRREPISMNDALNTKHFFMESPKLRYTLNGESKPVVYDFYWQRICVKEDVYEIRLKAKHRGGFIKAPTVSTAADPDVTVVQMAQRVAA